MRLLFRLEMSLSTLVGTNYAGHTVVTNYRQVPITHIHCTVKLSTNTRGQRIAKTQMETIED